MSYFLLQNGFITDYNFFIAVQLTFLTVAAIIFGFVTLKKDIKDQHKNETENIIQRESQKTKEYIRSAINKKIAYLQGLLSSIMWWFRKCIYCSLLSLLLILINIFNHLAILDFLIIVGVIAGSVIIWANVHFYKKIFDLDIGKEIDGILRDFKKAKIILDSKDPEVVVSLLRNR